MPKKIAHDATIATVWNSLTHQRDYGTSVFWKMKACAKVHPDTHVRIGVTGSGQKPCYRIFYKCAGDPTECIYGSYWDMGDALSNETAQNENWSTASMSISELEHLLREKLK